MSAAFNHIPATLRENPAWLVWQSVAQEGSKARKVPYYIDGHRRRGAQGRPADVERLGSFRKAKTVAASGDYAGLGMAMLPGRGLVALDFDNCVDGTNTVMPEVLALVSGTYAELSPSGHGVRAFYRDPQGVLSAFGNGKSLGDGLPFGFELFQSKGFVTVTGQRLPESAAEVACVSAAIAAFCEQRLGKPAQAVQATAATVAAPVGFTEQQLEEALTYISPDCEYQTWVNIGMALHHETEGASSGFDLWNDWSAGGSKYTSEAELAGKWAGFGHTHGKPVTVLYLLKTAGVGLDAPVSLDDFEPVADDEEATDTQTTQATEAALPVLHWSAFAQQPGLGWLVKKLLPHADLGVIYGASGSGKTFFTLDLVGAVACGRAWQGRKVKQGNVVYVAAEGAGGFRHRLNAYAGQWPRTYMALYVVPALVNRTEPNAVAAACKAIMAAVKTAAVVVVDTFAQSLAGGDENSGKDVSLALSLLKELGQRLGALVLLVHHSGKDTSKGARGWSGLRAAADVEIEITILDNIADTGQPVRRALVTKQKDGVEGEAFYFRLEPVTVGKDEDGESIDSCVVRFVEPPKQSMPLRGLPAVVLAALSELSLSGEAVPIEELLDDVAADMPPPEDGKKDRRRVRVRETIKRLENMGSVVVDEAKETVTLAL